MHSPARIHHCLCLCWGVLGRSLAAPLLLPRCRLDWRILLWCLNYISPGEHGQRFVPSRRSACAAGKAQTEKAKTRVAGRPVHTGCEYPRESLIRRREDPEPQPRLRTVLHWVGGHLSHVNCMLVRCRREAGPMETSEPGVA